MLNTLRFSDELADTREIELPDKASGLAAKEIAMAERLVEEMAGPWQPEQFEDSDRHDLMKRILERVRKHQAHTLTQATRPASPGSRRRSST